MFLACWIFFAGICGVAIFGIVISGCRAAPRVDPAEIYRQIRTQQLQGNLGEARREVAQAQQKYPLPSPWAPRFRILEAEILTDQGRSPEVVALLRASPPSKLVDDEVRVRILCALAYARTGQAQQSEEELQEAQALSAGGDSAASGEFLLIRGLIEQHYNRFASAADWYEKSAEASRQQGDSLLELRALLSLGAVALDSERFDDALGRFRETSELAQTLHAQQILETSLGNQGLAYYKLGDFEKSLIDFEQAEKQAEEQGATNQQIVWLRHAGLALYQLRNLDGAEADYGKAMKLAEAAQDRGAAGDNHLALGFLYLQQDRLPAAQQQGEEALRTARALGNPQAESLFLEGLIAARRHDDAEAQRLLMQAYEMAAGEPSMRWRVENAIANLYADAGQLHPAGQLSPAELWYRRSIHTFETQRSTLQQDELKLPFFANADVLYDDYAEYLIRSRRANQALLLLDAARARTLEEGLGVVSRNSDISRAGPVNPAGHPDRPGHLDQLGHPDQLGHVDQVDPRAIARKLNATILFYSLGSRKSYLWSINARSINLFELPSQAEIEKSVSNYQRSILSSADPMHQSNSEAKYLYEKLVAPAASAISSGSRVVLIPDGALSLLNFETLVTPKNKGGHYWIEDVTLTNANSIRLLSASSAATRKSKSRNLLLIGDAVSPSLEYAALPNASVEVDSVEKHFSSGARTVLTRANAVPGAYSASGPGQYAFIHFVAHATASRLSPLDSAVVLSAEPGHPDAYKLYARDIVHQPLHAELVTISSCNGSGSRAYAGEGLVGLSWAFLRAGSHNVIGALWEADDASTAKLMDRLYTGLDSGEQPDTALRDAKLAMIHSPGAYRKPYYWGAFQLQSGS